MSKVVMVRERVRTAANLDMLKASKFDLHTCNAIGFYNYMRRVRDEAIHVDLDFEGSIDEVIANLQQLKDDVGSEYVRIEIERDYSAESEAYVYILMGSRPEVEIERQLRLKLEESNREKQIEQEAEERRLFEKLKAKYEGK